ncbi:MAG: AAA family ATPase [Alphaproteobacteria bacterium]|jgi:predicted ATPase|nr:AAA family ATPase [Alphaproteobacteria bacterium]
MLTAFGIENFKSYKQATLPLAPLTVLIGANASGKSNAIEALRLLSWIARGNRLPFISDTLHRGDAPIRGTVTSLRHDEEGSITLACTATGEEWENYEIGLTVSDGQSLVVRHERLSRPGTPVLVFEIKNSLGDDHRVEYYHTDEKQKKIAIFRNDMAILQQISRVQFPDSGSASAISVARKCADDLSLIKVLDPLPAKMRNYSEVRQIHLASDGQNLSTTLAYLCQDHELRRDVLEFVQNLPEQCITHIHFLEGPRNEVMVALVETFGGQERVFDATLLSDGTLRVLAVAAAILSAPQGSLVVIEEIDNGIHPSRAHAILGQISQIAKDRELRVLISSHNPALLDALPDDAVPDVVFCYRDPQDGSSRLVRLADIPDYPELIAQGSVGHLMTRGLIDRFVKSDHSPEAKNQRFRDWLAELQADTGAA